MAPGVSRTTQKPDTREGGGKPACSEYKRAGREMWRWQRRAGLPEIQLCTRGMIREVNLGVDRYFCFCFQAYLIAMGRSH